MRKRSLTLLEVVIALSLAGVLLAALFGFYRHLFTVQTKVQKQAPYILQRAWIQEKLTQIFAKAVGDADEEGVLFYTIDHPAAIGKVLIFCYDNGIDREELYTGEVKAMLYLSSQKRLSLITWPERREILLEGVSSIQFSFFDSKEKIWKEEWATEAEELPSLVRLSLTSSTEKEPCTFIFLLSRAHKKISYTKAHA